MLITVCDFAVVVVVCGKNQSVFDFEFVYTILNRFALEIDIRENFLSHKSNKIDLTLSFCCCCVPKKDIIVDMFLQCTEMGYYNCLWCVCMCVYSQSFKSHVCACTRVLFQRYSISIA